jgi:hypothetical protein
MASRVRREHGVRVHRRLGGRVHIRPVRACRVIFVAVNHRRSWCVPEICGNRVRVAAVRGARQARVHRSAEGGWLAGHRGRPVTELTGAQPGPWPVRLEKFLNRPSAGSHTSGVPVPVPRTAGRRPRTA